MNGFACWSINDRRDVFAEVASRRNLSPVIVEKDFWVVWTLQNLFESPAFRDHIVFKGGTSLSKVYGVIERFSEDIDLSIDERILGVKAALPHQLTKNQRQKRFDHIRDACERYVSATVMPVLYNQFTSILGTPALRGWSLAASENDPATLIFRYPSAVGARLAYIQPSVRLEFGSGVDPWPILQREVVSMAAEEFSSLFRNPSATVTCLEIARTFWEKTTIIHMANTRTKVASINRISRHFYDLAQMCKSPDFQNPLESLDLLRRVADHKAGYFPTSGVNYTDCYSGKLVLSPSEDRRSALHDDYAAMRAMFYATVVPFDTLLATIEKLEMLVNDAAMNSRRQ